MSATPPGRMQPNVQPDVIAMFCTAGHVDHGKTCLVKMLTGCATDRLREEQERGLTIELGFAPCWLGEGLCAGIVDVPGHERFVRTMVAGVSGMDFCVLVVAADDGIMPQTREHVDIMQLMGLDRGIVALTKIDRVSRDQVDFRTGELREYLASTFLRDAPVCPVSSVTGAGYDGFYDTLVASLKSGLRQRAEGVFRMPVERAFLRPGFGAVVTGIPIAGRIAVGNAIECVPGGQRGHVRGLQRFAVNADVGGAGQCLALNIPEFAGQIPVRGQILCAPDTVEAGHLFHVRIRAVGHLERPLRNAETVAFHTGTADTPARVFLLDPRELAGGQTALASVRTTMPVAAAAGDRIVLRRASPRATIAGGLILHADGNENRPRRIPLLARLRQMEAFLGDADGDSPDGHARRIRYRMALGPKAAWTPQELSRATLLPDSVVQRELRKSVAEQTVLEVATHLFADAGRTAALVEAMHCRLTEMAQSSDRLRIPLGEWKQAFDVPAALWRYGCKALEKSTPVRIREGSALPFPAVNGLPDQDRALALRMLEQFKSEGYQTTHPNDLPTVLSVSSVAASRVLDYLCACGDLVRVAANVVITIDVARQAQQRIIETIRDNGTLDSTAFRDQLGVSRKYAMAILDFFDARRITRRDQNSRRLVLGWEDRLL